MNKLTLARVLCAAALMTSAVAPCYALDYEAKPVMWVLQAPFRTAGALTGGLVTGAISAPIDKGHHWFWKGTRGVAGKFGDEHGCAQVCAAAPIGGSTGMVLGSGYGVPYGFLHGFKAGWDKPFSRWSYLTAEGPSK